MARVVMVHTAPTLKIADTQGALTTGKAFECQVTSAVIKAQPKTSTIPATGCAGESQAPGATGWQLEIDWLQDWTAGAALSLSSYAMTNDGVAKWVEFVPDKLVPTTKFQFQCYIVAGDIGGTFGAGEPGVSKAVWYLLNAPTPTIPALEETETTETAAVAEPVPA